MRGMKTRKIEFSLDELAIIESSLGFAAMHLVPLSRASEEAVDSALKKVQEAQLEIVEELELEREGK